MTGAGWREKLDGPERLSRGCLTLSEALRSAAYRLSIGRVERAPAFSLVPWVSKAAAQGAATLVLQSKVEGDH